MSAKEQLLAQAPGWSEHDAEIALRAVQRDHETEARPGDVVDEWGDLSAIKRHSASRLMKRLSEEEIAANGQTLAEAWGYEPKNPR